MWEGIRNQKHGAYFPTVLRGHSGLPKPGLRLNTLLVEAASGQQRASRVYSRGCQRLATTASHLRTVSFQHPSRYTLPLLPSLLPFLRCIFFFSCYHLAVHGTEESLFNAELELRASCQEWGSSKKEAHGRDSAITVPPGSSQN